MGALLSFGRAGTPQDLLVIAQRLRAANPGAEANLVLYEPGLPKTSANRRLLTREVGLMVEQGEDPRGIVSGLSVQSLRAVPGVPGGYVVEATDPWAALELADTLRQTGGVRSAYPLLKRGFFPR